MTGAILAQENDSTNVEIEDETTYITISNKKNDEKEMKTIGGKHSHNGGFFGVNFKYTDIKDKANVMVGVKGGWIINRVLAIGFEGQGVIPSAKYSGIDPLRNVVLIGGYGGMFIEPIVFSNEVVHLTFPISGGAGWFGYSQDWDDNNNSTDLVSDDVFWYVEPSVMIEVNVAKNFRIGTGISQRFVQDLNLAHTASSDFEGLNYVFTLKFGRF